jgi:tRNA nucleotidyltransferase (CCA-adding enzyme)
MRILLVGGAVRDLVLGRPVTDKDYLVLDASEPEFRERFPEALPVGKAFPVFWLHGDQFAFPRAEGVDADLAGRDFTANALALDEDGELFAHPRALGDVGGRLLRPCSQNSLRDDPLRACRAARFLAQMPEFRPTQDLLQAMRREGESGRLADLDPERVGVELRKAMQSPRPGDFLRRLAETGCLAPWFAELDGAQDVPAGPQPYHEESVLEHTAEVMDRLAGQGEAAVFMGLCHDLGKTATPREFWPKHHGHDRKGEDLARTLARRLRLPSRMEQAGAAAARHHMNAARYPELRPGTRVDVLGELQAANLVHELFQVVQADHGEDHSQQALADLEAMKAVRLPPEDRNKGAESGEKLRLLRCQAVSETSRGR